MFNPKDIRLADAAYVILTHVCDKNCPFCSDLYRIYCKDPEHICVKDSAMSYETAEKITEKLIEHGTKRVTLVGGEATLNPEFVKICKLFHSHFDVVCTSSMSRIDRILEANDFVDHWNFSIYSKIIDFNFTEKLKGTVTLSKLLFDGDLVIKGPKDLDNFIDTYGKRFNLKFSTLRNVNRFCSEREHVSWIKDLHDLKEVMIFNGEVYAYEYRGYFIDRKNVEPLYSKNKLPTSLKVHPNGIIDTTWDEPWNRRIENEGF